MHVVDSPLVFFATDLSNFLACPQLTLLDRRTAFGGPRPPQYDDPGIPVLQQRGLEHEHAFLAKLRAAGKSITEIVDLEGIYGIEKWRQLHEQTVAAMRAGVDVVYQGTLFNAPWGGRPDFLVRVETPSRLGAWSYRVVDTKLARQAKAGALLQVLHYAHLVADVQGVLPEHVHIALGGPDAHEESFRVADYAAYFRSVRRRFEAFVAANPDLTVAPDPVEHCGICAWSGTCDQERHDVDHLSLVAGITSGQRRKLREASVDTLIAFADAACPDKKLARVHAQALIQLEGRRANANKFELLPVLPELGLAALPEPNRGDLFFDLEGDPYYYETTKLRDYEITKLRNYEITRDYGIEYLFGWVDARGQYSAQWSLTPEQERKAFELFIDFVMARLEQYPDLHIYHYNHYETTALKRLMGRYGTREDEVDRLLRGGVFVDLYRVVRNGLRASVESYSIKKLEPFYGYDRVVDMREANQALANFCASLELGLQTTSDAAIEGYNRDDCVSTLRLRDWLETLRTADMPRPVVKDPDPEAEQEQQQEEVARLVAQLMALGTREGELLGHLLEYHRREKKTWWWDYYRRKGLAADEILEERTMIGGLEFLESWKDTTPRSQSHIYRYRYPRQEHSLKIGDKTENPAIDKQGTGEVFAVDEVASTIDLKRKAIIEHPAAIMEYDYIGDTAQRKRLFELGEAYAAGLATGCGVDLLHVSTPGNVLGIQGPPGAGKTYTAARMIVELLNDGKRVGVTANSHKVIGKLLEEVCEAAAEAGVVVNGIQKAKKDDWCGLALVDAADDTDKVVAALAAGTKTLAAGTAWLWASQDMVDAVDVLFIDEAGQFALADALAVAHATEKLVLLGDPQQLDKPQKGAHPPGVAVSALGHMLGEDTTMPAERGTFLEHTWRLPKAICAFTSELFYDGRLEPRDGALEGDVRLETVEHAGNTNESPEEAEAVARLVAKLRDDGYALEDILIVAPYNLQVAEIAERLPGARVGTVDKFQGQEAKVAIYSMATSSAADAPRGMKFLYSPNRFNVATSRAKEIAVVVASPEVFAPECKTPEQMKFANAFCRFAELCVEIEPGGPHDSQVGDGRVSPLL